MRKIVMEGDVPFLSEEIIRNILKRLPVRSLIRFQCVCKQWKNLIKTPSFIADHLHHSTHQNPLLLFQWSDRYHPLQLCLLDCGMKVHEVQNAPVIDFLSFVRIVGSSNGLLCLELHSYDIFPRSLLLWNPAIREVKLVPRTINNFEDDWRLGFGFSPIVSDYKIVRTYAKLHGAVNRVEVYSLRTGLWKEIDLGKLEVVKLFPETVTSNGAMFWYGSKLGAVEAGENDIDLIVSFDIAMEVFTLIPPPPLVSHFNAELTVYENKLAILSDILNGDFQYFSLNLWVMEEGTDASGERWSWIKKYSSSPYTCLLSPMTIWRNEIVCIVDPLAGPNVVIECDGENDKPETLLSLFNLDANVFKMFAVRICGHGYRIFNYVESLVPVGNIDIEEP